MRQVELCSSRGSVSVANYWGKWVNFRCKSTSRAVYDYFKQLRDKHTVHDENPWCQSLAGVVINYPGAARKVADTVSTAFSANFVREDIVVQLGQLVEAALAWTRAKSKELGDQISKEYETYTYDELASRPDVKYKTPLNDEIGVRRHTS